MTATLTPRFPRPRGDEPYTGGALVTIERFSPPARG